MDGLIGRIESDVVPLAKLVGSSAPLLGSLLGSPLAGIAISLIASKFGANPQSIEDVIAKVTGSTNAPGLLTQIEAENSETLAKISSDEYAQALADVQDARKYGQEYKDFLRHFSYLVTAGFFIALFLLFLPLNLAAEEKNLLSMLVGMLASKWQTIVDFFYGSSKSQGGVSK